MLTVGKVGPGNAGYYEAAVVAGVEDYYAGAGEVPGRWVGRADLVGAVAGSLATAVDSKLLLEARCAPDGSRLGKTVVTQRSVTAFDLTFSAPKSVSVLYALGDERVVAAVEAAHTAAAEQAIASVSLRVAYTRTGHAGAAVVDADGLLGIRYRHRTSRALDPQLHDHVLISNAVRTLSDGEWRTLDARGLYRNAKAAGIEYQAFLRAALQTSLGVEFSEVDGNGQADIVGFDQDLLMEFSTRGVDVESELDRWIVEFVEREGRKPTAVETGKAHKTITLATRPAKPDEASCTIATLRDGWRARADGVVDVDRVLDRVLGNPSLPGVIVRPTVDEALRAVEEKHADWAEAQLIEQIAMRVTGPVPAAVAAMIEAVRSEVMASTGVIDLAPSPEPGDVLRASDGRPVHLPPSALRYTTRRHLLRELDIVEWAASTASAGHRPVAVERAEAMSLDDGQAAAVTAMLFDSRPVMTVVGPAGAGKTRMLAAAVAAWKSAGVDVFGAGPSASAARQLCDSAGTVADTLHKLVYEHSTKQANGQGPAGERWCLPEGSVVIIDEAGMVDTRLLHEYSQIARAQNWRTVLVGDHHQLDAVDAGGMFAELVDDPDVVTVELDALHRFEHGWEADASLALRSGNASAIEAYGQQGRIHGHGSQQDVIEAVAAAAVAGAIDGRNVLVLAPTNAVVDALNETVTTKLLDVGQLNSRERIEVGGRVFYPGQPIVTRVNDRRLTYGPMAAEWVRNGDRWTVDTGTRDGLFVSNSDNGRRIVLPADYVAAGSATVHYASTIHRAQGATVDEAHVIIDERTDAQQLYVGMTRGRTANHLHAAPHELDLDRHGPTDAADEWTPTEAFSRALQRQSDHMSAIGRRRQLREATAETQTRRFGGQPGIQPEPAERAHDEGSERTAIAMRRLQSLARRPSRGLEL